MIHELWTGLTPDAIGRLPFRGEAAETIIRALQANNINRRQVFMGRNRLKLEGGAGPRTKEALRILHKEVKGGGRHAVHRANNIFKAAERARLPMQHIFHLPDIYKVLQALPTDFTERQRWATGQANRQSAMSGARETATHQPASAGASW